MEEQRLITRNNVEKLIRNFFLRERTYGGVSGQLYLRIERTHRTKDKKKFYYWEITVNLDDVYELNDNGDILIICENETQKLGNIFKSDEQGSGE